jgi:hypothetical protein
MRTTDEAASTPRRVRVDGRDDVGFVINEGVNLGAPTWNIFCVIVHFPDTGECIHYDKTKVTTVE